MAFTYTANKLYLAMPTVGTESGTWGDDINDDLTRIDAAMGGMATADISAGDWTVSSSDWLNLRLKVTGASLAANRQVTLPSSASTPTVAGGFWIFHNAVTNMNGKTITITTAAGGATGVVIPATATVGEAYLIYTDGTNVKYADAGVVAQYLPLAGGTVSGATTFSSTVATGALTVTGAVNVTGAITASGDITAYSDRRLKNDITPIDNALAIVNKLRGVRYVDRLGDHKVGVIAQEVEPHLPEVVAHGPEYLSVAYSNMVGVLISAINELTARVEELEKK